MEEIEVKFLDIDVGQIEKKLVTMGAKKVGDYLYIAKTFDHPDARLHSDNSWIRLRDEVDKITLAYKKRIGVTSHDGSTSDEGMQEIQIEVDSFENTEKLLLAIGLIEKFKQEKKRTKYVLGDVEFDIDTWPLIPPYLEIEAKSFEKIKEMSALLGLDYDKHFRSSANAVFKKYGFDDHDYSVLAFDRQVKKN